MIELRTHKGFVLILLFQEASLSLQKLVPGALDEISRKRRFIDALWMKGEFQITTSRRAICFYSFWGDFCQLEALITFL